MRMWCDVVQLQQQAPVASSVDVRARSMPMGVAPGELKLDLGPTSPPPGRSRTASLPSTQNSSDEEMNDDDIERQPSAVAGPLRTHVATMARQFVEEGRATRRSVLEHLHRFSDHLSISNCCSSARHVICEICQHYVAHCLPALWSQWRKSGMTPSVIVTVTSSCHHCSMSALTSVSTGDGCRGRHRRTNTREVAFWLHTNRLPFPALRSVHLV